MNEFFLGTAVKITDVISEIAPDSIKISIEDPEGTEKADAKDMSKSADYNYYYIYQSDDDDKGGVYTAVIEITKGDHVSMEKTTWLMKSATPQWADRH